jgi:SAM-dependent methyltransferase
MNAPYDNFASFYDLEYGHRDEDISFYLELAQKFKTPILEIGVGTCRIAIPMAKAGYTIWGIDNSAEMLGVAEQKLSALPEEIRDRILLFHRDMRDFVFKKRFPLVTVPFRAFLHNQTMEDQLYTLRNIHRHLKPRGILALDLFVPIYSVFANRKWQEQIAENELSIPNSGVSILCDITHRPEKQMLSIENTYRYTCNGKPKTKKCVMHYRYVFRFEMELLLKQAGFLLEAVHGGFRGERYDFNSGIAVFIARKA